MPINNNNVTTNQRLSLLTAAVAACLLWIPLSPASAADEPAPSAEAGTPAKEIPIPPITNNLTSNSTMTTTRLWARPSFRPNDPSRPTVCLVHGMNSTSSGFAHLIPALEKAGYGVLLYDYPDSQSLSASIPAFIRDWLAFRSTSADRLPWALLGHSMGSLVARGYVEGSQYAQDVSHLILIAPPNDGSAAADFQGILDLLKRAQAAVDTRFESWYKDRAGNSTNAAAADLRPGSPFLAQLNALPRRAGVAYHILAGDSGFLTQETRRTIQARIDSIASAGGLFAGLVNITAGDYRRRFDELSNGTGDGVVSIASTRLSGVADHTIIHANHVELIRGPMLYPEPGPIACLPSVLLWLQQLPRVGMAGSSP